MLNLDRLRVLCAVALHQSINGAAVALHVSPSAVSQQISKLEREVGQTLMDRDGRGIRLTQPALLLAERASHVIESLDALEGEFDTFINNIGGPVTVAAFPTAARGLGPELLMRLAEFHPRLEPSLVELEPKESLRALASGELDVVIAQDWFNAPLALPPGLDRLDLFDDIVDVALHASHRLATRRSVSLSDLEKEAWVTWPPHSICHDWLVHTYRSSGIEPTIAHTAAEHATQLALVAAGFGPAIIPRLGRGPVPNGVKMVKVEPTLRRHVFVVSRTHSSRASNVAAVRKTLALIKVK
jgi:DNA-binding transcriptional LysR family regulator